MEEPMEDAPSQQQQELQPEEGSKEEHHSSPPPSASPAKVPLRGSDGSGEASDIVQTLYHEAGPNGIHEDGYQKPPAPNVRAPTLGEWVTGKPRAAMPGQPSSAVSVCIDLTEGDDSEPEAEDPVEERAALEKSVEDKVWTFWQFNTS